ncbi:MAG: UbiH/UbiF family hydroxylase [Salinarimonas sp.]|nr:UbiH/UbiF family hydroxylase [Salinarimonas sp.]
MSDHHYDTCVVGAGAAGLAAALTFAREGYSVAVIGEAAARRDGRTVALLDGSVHLLERLGIWDALEPHAAPLEIMRLIDDTDSLFRAPTVDFKCREIGLDAFGWNVENATLVQILAEAVRVHPEITSISNMAMGLGSQDTVTPGSQDQRITVSLDDGSRVAAALVIAADGRNSPMRRAAGIRERNWRYPQAALTTILEHERDHRDISTEFHTRHGPFTLVPLPGRRSSLVWVTEPEKAAHLREYTDAALARTIERQAHAILGKMTIDGPRGVVPMGGLSVARFHADRLALVGEAAHAFPPIGAQGLNLGLRDVAALRDAVVASDGGGADPGSAAALRRYDRGRRFDVRSRTLGVDMLNRTLLSGLLPADFLRGAGLRMLAHVTPLRRVMMREGVSPRLATPQLMRREAPAPAPAPM